MARIADNGDVQGRGQETSVTDPFKVQGGRGGERGYVGGSSCSRKISVKGWNGLGCQLSSDPETCLGHKDLHDALAVL